MSTERESTSAASVDPLGGLVLDPSNELRFRGPFDDYVTVSLSIRNPTENRIAFKIKTTAPKRYCVKPNSGVLDPGQSMKVNVLLQPFNYDPNEKNKHKFMVQYMYLNNEEIPMSANDILNTWKDVPTSRLLDIKLKCLFEFTEAEQAKLAEQLRQQTAAASASASTVSAAPTHSSPSQSQQPDKSAAKLAISGAAATTAAATANTVSSSAAQQQQQQQSSAAAASDAVSSSSGTSRSSIATTSAVNKTALHPTSADQTVYSNSSDVAHADFDSSGYVGKQHAAATGSSASATARLEKNDNTINELKLSRQDNELLKKEINRLKEEEARLRKLALQAPSARSSSSSSSSSAPNSLEINSFADLLNNRLFLIIIILIAIIVYLLLFR